MITFSGLINLATQLSQNSSPANQNTIATLLNEQHRLQIEDYFDNERSFSTETVGADNLSLSAAPVLGDVTATLSTAWNHASGEQTVYFKNTIATQTLAAQLSTGATSGTLTVAWPYSTQILPTTFSDGEVRNVSYTNTSTAISWTTALTSSVATSLSPILPAADSPVAQFTNGSTTITWQEPLNSDVTSTSFSTGGYQKYRIPAGISKITNNTISVGQLRFVPAPVQTRRQWDELNFLPYPSDIPNYFFIYGPYVEIWPVPSTTGNMLTFNYKTRVSDFSTAFLFADAVGTQFILGTTSGTTYDYQLGTVAASLDGITVTGTGTKWVTTQGTGKGLGMPVDTDISQYNLGFRVDPPYGDGLWYPIQQFHSDTSLTLATPIQNAPNISGATYSIGQLPLLQEDFHPMIVYAALMMYFSTIVPDPNKFKQFQVQYQERIQKLAEYAGTKQVSYNLGEKPVLLNPNSYPYYPQNVQS